MNAYCASLDDSVGGMDGDRTRIASDGLIGIPLWLVISRALHLLLFTAHHMHLYTYSHACIICTNVVSIYIWLICSMLL